MTDAILCLSGNIPCQTQLLISAVIASVTNMGSVFYSNPQLDSFTPNRMRHIFLLWLVESSISQY